MGWLGRFLLSSPEDFPVKAEVMIILLSLGKTTACPSVLLGRTICRGNITGGFPGDGFLEQRRAKHARELGRGPENLPGRSGCSWPHCAATWAPSQLVSEHGRERCQ